MGCILCCTLKKKYNQIDANNIKNSKNNSDKNSRLNINLKIKNKKKYKRPEYLHQSQNNILILNDNHLQSFDNILLNNTKNKQQNYEKRADIYRKWRSHYLNNSGTSYIGLN